MPSLVFGSESVWTSLLRSGSTKLVFVPALVAAECNEAPLSLLTDDKPVPTPGLFPPTPPTDLRFNKELKKVCRTPSLPAAPPGPVAEMFLDGVPLLLVSRWEGVPPTPPTEAREVFLDNNGVPPPLIPPTDKLPELLVFKLILEIEVFPVELPEGRKGCKQRKKISWKEVE